MRAVLITGVSSGIGESIADELLSTNEFIVIGSVRSIDDAKNLKDQYENFYEVIFDVTNKEAILKGKIEVEKILKENNSYLSCLINNAGIAVGGPIRYLDVDFFRHQFEVNFFGLIEVTKIFLD